MKNSPWLNLLLNLAWPIFVLNKLSDKIGPTNALILSLMGPLLSAYMDFRNEKKLTAMTILGIVNVIFTGGFALIHVEGIYFAMKEASLPLILGGFVLWSSRQSRTMVETLFFPAGSKQQIFNRPLIDEKIVTDQQRDELKRIFRTSTQFLSLSFLFSAVLNFVLAYYIFVPIDKGLEETERSYILNQQISHMTTWSFPVIAVPSLLLTAAIIWKLLGELKSLTGLSTEEILHQPS